MSELLRVAHRAGNDLERLVPALAAGADLVEADVHAHRGRLEVRHTKTLGPLPWLWDRWYLVPASDPRLYLHGLAEALPPTSHVMLDLKGWHPRLGARVRDTMAAAAPGAPYTVCSRTWSALRAFDALPHVRVVHSVRNRLELRLLLHRLRTRPTWGVSIHRDLLTAGTVRRLHEHAEVVMTWPVNTPDALMAVREVGVDAVISDHLEALGLTTA
jgi:glycerophosphoryl diester phosphodiesterase